MSRFHWLRRDEPAFLPHIPSSERIERISVAEDADRNWDSLSKVTDDAMNAILDILIGSEEPIRQQEIRIAIEKRLGVPSGTAAAYTSAGLLHFREIGWVEPVGREDGSTLWRIAA